MDCEKKTYLSIKKILTRNILPAHAEIFEITESVSELLENEKTDYRVPARNGEAGGLISFAETSLPVIIVPDLHARPYFLMNILDYVLPDGRTIFHHLVEKTVILVFVGDILHTERSTRQRWLAVQKEFDQQIFTGPSISMEMQEGLSLLLGLLELKKAFPVNCHILKGNHENIMNINGGGDYSFKKTADEGYMCKIFLQEYYGDDIVYMIHCVEKSLPVIFQNSVCVVSHAEPAEAYTKDQLINARTEEKVVEGLTWTANGCAQEGSVESILKNLIPENFENAVYFAGHRPVTENYKIQHNGKFVQIHNPSKQNIAVVYNNKKFNPKEDIFEVKK